MFKQVLSFSNGAVSTSQLLFAFEENMDGIISRLVLFGIISYTVTPTFQAWYLSMPDGDIKIAGIFNVHMKGNEAIRNRINCGIIDPQYGIMFVEAMLFALDRINNDSSILHGLKLRARIYDTCGDKRHLRNMLAHIANYASQGVIGPQYSDDAITTATVMNIFGKNTISYAATSPDLENRARYGYFYRTVPSDYNAAKLLASLALKFKWRYIALISSEGNYGQRASDLFRNSAQARGICFPIDMTIPEDARRSDYIYALRKIKEKSSVKVVFLLLTDHHLMKFFEIAEQMKNETEGLNFVASDGYGTRSFIAAGKTAANGTITFQVGSGEVQEFKEYFLKLNPRKNKRNVWFKEFWERTFNCSFRNSSSSIRCTGRENLRNGLGYYSETPVLSVINAVYAYAYAFKKVIWYECLRFNKTVKRCFHEKRMLQGLTSYRAVLFYVSRTKFKEPFREKIFQFNAAGDHDENYTIFNIQYSDSSGKHIFRPIGSWNNVENKTFVYKNNIVKNVPLKPETWRLKLDPEKIGWKSGTLPESICSKPCDVGYVLKVKTVCCWTCLRCSKNDVIRNNTCIPCHMNSAPDQSHKNCHALPVRNIGMYNEVSTTVFCFSISGILVTVAVVGLFLKNFDRRLVKASSRELCLLMLFGIAVLYATPVVFIVKPSYMVCNMQRVIVGIGLTACYAPLLLRTNRIYRIFKNAKTTVSRPSMISPRSQIAMSLATTGIGVLIGVVSIIGRVSKINTAYPAHRQFIVQYCELGIQTIIVNLSFSSALMIATTWFAFQTRNFPKNYNEAKYIGFTMYTTCLVLAVVLPLFIFIDDEEGRSRALVLCALSLLNASINLTGLFGHKVKLLLSKNMVAIDCNISTVINPTTIKTNIRSVGITPDCKDRIEMEIATSND